MYFHVGKYGGKSVEQIMFTDPSYIDWILNKQSLTGPLERAKLHIGSLIKKFDAKPFIKVKCRSGTCNNSVTEFTVYFNNIAPVWWCSTCDPYQLGATPGKLQTLTDYKSALRHVKIYCGGRKPDFKKIIKTIAQAKGIPARVTEVQAQEFFK